MPKITYDDSLRRPIPSLPPRPRKRVEKVYSDVPNGWLPPSHLEKRWTAIVIHHSATGTGSVSVFARYHRENKGWAGVGYDFVIGNGTDSGDGEVEVTLRWREQRTGAHCKTPNNWANEDAVGICLVGDFSQSVPTSRQMWSLAKLVRFLQARYRIPTSRVYSHKYTPGARPTDCPGRNFPMARLKSMLNY
ncbi:MAG: peptidoglycan recognition protein family protein [Planctomycetota bacterium]